MEERYLQECPKCGGEGNIGFSYNKKKCKLCGGTGEVYIRIIQGR